MSAERYCQIQSSVHGPMTATNLKRMAERGQLTPTDHVRRGDAGKWVLAGAVKGLPFGEKAAQATALLPIHPPEMETSPRRESPSEVLGLPTGDMKLLDDSA